MTAAGVRGCAPRSGPRCDRRLDLLAGRRRHAKVESAAWARFAAPGSTTEFCASWLAILCGQLDRVNGAMVLLQSGEPGSFSPAATWPDAAQNLLHLGPTAEATLKDRRGVVQSGLSARRPPPSSATRSRSTASCTARRPGHAPRPDPDVQRVLRQIHWGSAWLLDQFRQQAQRAERERIGRLAVANEILATALQEGSLGACMLAVANDLAARLSCERVAVGLVRARHLRGEGHLAHRDVRPAQRLRAAARRRDGRGARPRPAAGPPAARRRRDRRPGPCGPVGRAGRRRHAVGGRWPTTATGSAC
jgi:hypothetical protein